ncbi:hypothetical protein DPMN_064508 [Dreissena polymorpha]|uniref:Uncharacterized protein n=1 Tax=Dreissena polymorpha TaxID=45954 RepID=A0A9D4HK54_DREPO|nr:hypothetical protein DPMN_064491 [Dreissena polymorpha]KAH3721579.1 hypothetical protein DPMN_064508 [Dreissena polymorpha]
MPYAARLASDKPAHPCSLVRSYHVRQGDHETLRDFIVDSIAPDQTARLRMLVWNYAGLIGHTAHFRMTRLIFQ